MATANVIQQLGRVVQGHRPIGLDHRGRGADRALAHAGAQGLEAAAAGPAVSLPDIRNRRLIRTADHAEDACLAGTAFLSQKTPSVDMAGCEGRIGADQEFPRRAASPVATPHDPARSDLRAFDPEQQQPHAPGHPVMVVLEYGQRRAGHGLDARAGLRAAGAGGRSRRVLG